MRTLYCQPPSLSSEPKQLANSTYRTTRGQTFNSLCLPPVTRRSGELQCIQKFVSQTLFDFKRMVSHSISTKFSGKIPCVLSKPRICFLVSKDKTVLFLTGLSRSGKRTQKSEFRP